MAPPVTLITWPVMKLDSSESRNATTLATSLGSPIRFIGMLAQTASSFSGEARLSLVSGVTISPGDTQLMRMFLSATSRMKAFVNVMMPPFVAP